MRRDWPKRLQKSSISRKKMSDDEFDEHGGRHIPSVSYLVQVIRYFDAKLEYFEEQLNALKKQIEDRGDE